MEEQFLYFFQRDDTLPVLLCLLFEKWTNFSRDADWACTVDHSGRRQKKKKRCSFVLLSMLLYLFYYIYNYFLLLLLLFNFCFFFL